jgi:hypothetical protein
VHADISEGNDALLVSLAGPDIPTFRTRLRALTGAELETGPWTSDQDARPITVRLACEVDGEP